MSDTANQPHGADFSLAGRVVVITGGAGLIGVRHAEAIAAAGGTPVIADRRGGEADAVAQAIAAAFAVPTLGVAVDVSSEASVRALFDSVMMRFGRVDALVNNAANNPKVEDASSAFSRLEDFPLEQWNADIAVGLTGAFLCAKVFGTAMAAAGRGVIVNISSEYGIIAPDQRLYTVDGTPENQQPKKPVSYTAVKAGLHGLTMYLATYWADKGVRANTITLGGVENGQPAEFLARAAGRIPMARMARPSDFQGALVWLCSDASAFVTGANVVVDGGKSVW